MWNQEKTRQVAANGQVLSVSGTQIAGDKRFDLPKLPKLSRGHGFSIDMWIRFDDLSPGQIVLDSREVWSHNGFAVVMDDKECLRLLLNDGKTMAEWSCDTGLIRKDTWHHVVYIVDGSPNIISVLVDGKLCDGAGRRLYGWGRFPAQLGDVSGPGKLRLAPSLKGTVKSLRIYNRYLMTSEAVGNYNAGRRR